MSEAESPVYQLYDEDPRDLIRENRDELYLSRETVERAIDIVEECVDAGLLNGRRSRPFAAAACYIATMLEEGHRKQMDLAETFGTTATSLRGHYQRQAREIGEGWIVEENREGNGKGAGR
jgi:transcription initiation factor TFIIB